MFSNVLTLHPFSSQEARRCYEKLTYLLIQRGITAPVPPKKLCQDGGVTRNDQLSIMRKAIEKKKSSQ